MMNSEDWNSEILRRYRNAAQATAEAREFDRQASVIVDRMRERGAATIADLFPDAGLDPATSGSQDPEVVSRSVAK